MIPKKILVMAIAIIVVAAALGGVLIHQPAQ